MSSTTIRRAAPKLFSKQQAAPRPVGLGASASASAASIPTMVAPRVARGSPSDDERLHRPWATPVSAGGAAGLPSRSAEANVRRCASARVGLSAANSRRASCAAPAAVPTRRTFPQGVQARARSTGPTEGSGAQAPPEQRTSSFEAADESFDARFQAYTADTAGSLDGASAPPRGPRTKPEQHPVAEGLSLSPPPPVRGSGAGAGPNASANGTGSAVIPTSSPSRSSVPASVPVRSSRPALSRQASSAAAPSSPTVAPSAISGRLTAAASAASMSTVAPAAPSSSGLLGARPASTTASGPAAMSASMSSLGSSATVVRQPSAGGSVSIVTASRPATGPSSLPQAQGFYTPGVSGGLRPASPLAAWQAQPHQEDMQRGHPAASGARSIIQQAPSRAFTARA